jgi:hypothetical protein
MAWVSGLSRRSALAPGEAAPPRPTAATSRDGVTAAVPRTLRLARRFRGLTGYCGLVDPEVIQLLFFDDE